MDQIEPRRTAQELDPLTDSLASRVRWRVSDYAAIFRAQIHLLLAAEAAEAKRARPAGRRGR
ncbi:MAG: hypothetical protein JXB36_10860 [Gammaproteobacteria bacterium]|nr:hypothetical protein [Gammaproteobacteria bacterium]